MNHFTFKNDSSNQNYYENYENGVKNKILESSLPFVKKHGWTIAALSDGAINIGYPGISHGIFSSPNEELVNYFNLKCNKILNKEIRTFTRTIDGSIGTSKFVENALQLRLKMIIPYIERWPEALAIMSSPANISTAFNTFSILIDDICHFSGDESADFNWYSRRLAVAMIYKSTELFMIQDTSQDYKETWKFLERRVTDAFSIDQFLRTNENFGVKLKEITSASITMVLSKL